MRKGYFKRIDPTPYKVRLELTGPVTIVQQNDVIYADVATFKDVIGFEFVGWNKPVVPSTDPSTDPLKPMQMSDFQSMNIVAVQGQRQAPHKVFLENKKKEEEAKKSEPTVIKCIEADDAPPVQTTVTKTEDDKQKDKSALIEYLSKFDQKKWFVMKKETAKDYLERLGVDYSTLPNSKNEYIKCLRDYIKSVA